MASTRSPGEPSRPSTATSSAGSFVFGVGVAPPSSPPDQAGGGTSQSGSPPGIVARWILYLGLVALIGAAFVAIAVARRPVSDLLAMAAAGWVLTAIGTVGVVAVQWAETGAPIEELPGSSVGTNALRTAYRAGRHGYSPGRPLGGAPSPRPARLGPRRDRVDGRAGGRRRDRTRRRRFRLAAPGRGAVAARPRRGGLDGRARGASGHTAHDARRRPAPRQRGASRSGPASGWSS